jgi:DNA-binding MarR family transcriptional regulator
MAAKTPVRETELKEGKGERKELKLTEEQRNSLLEIFRTAREMPISELAKKLNVDQDVLQGALERLAQAGKLSLKIEGGILYLGKKQR